jgi:D-alanyl-D-alanine carboxypeptidase/D-alanyl-D-alanine-endopeptidase (penicillin-binding protein 4)
MNVHSVNHMAERLFLRLGERRYGPPATREKGRRALAAYLAGFGLPVGEMATVDGSGLSRQDHVTPRAMARYLREITRRPWFPRLAATLPHPGVEGTVKDIGYTDRRFRVKTGRLDDMFALAGYGVDRNGRELVFVFLANFPAEATDRRHSRGYVVRLLAEGALPGE